ncbi:flagellar export chaperone FliS [Peribacillus psychrosaccharolyticus]|uniref:Flagellar export chaperone FliS n=1 Tax=Peribacillus psychrosaccharolyticus TaxID=1407 RepID=A0A974NJN4_PERPY|nr:flagellar export chaperone FliS [Peribacillus psychrosaccharolyticus]MEC2055488.1 flagellar export chaperone FliS [Peribacillus psychrosaccharolyticus]MED3743484.1 flagellar export chaperone FliS [Peribacillus psychrosaccharolyticus]QQS99165.1 flagellar export chaperone FliS [Peribacillus psychrosaccharolyticus]
MELLTNEVIYKKTPQELTAFLYEGLIVNLEAARDLIAENKLFEANQKLQKSNDIVERLGIGLKYEAGPIAEQLDSLYNYMANQIILANRKKDTSLIENVLKIIGPIAQAWNTAMKTNVNPAVVRKMSAYESNIMRENTNSEETEDENQP